MSLVKRFLQFFYCYAYSLARNKYRSLIGGCHFTILVYHRVSDEFNDSVTVKVEQFKNQILHIESNYEVISLESLFELKNKKLTKPVIAITFDDGYADNYEAARFLKDQNIKATFFISTGIVGTTKTFPHDLKRLGRRVPSLTWAQVEEMSQWGHSFGSHTADHPNLAFLSADEAVQQIKQGQNDLLNRLGPSASTEMFAYPHGRKEDLPESARSLLPGLGIKYCFSAYGGVNRKSFDNYDVCRQGIDSAFSDLAFRAALEGWQVRVPKRK